MYTKFVEVLAQHSKDIFSEMTGAEVLAVKFKRDERLDESMPMSHAIDYEHLEKKVKGQFILGFASKTMALAVASALAEKVGMGVLNELDEIAADVLNEFLNTIVGRTISDWDRMGMPVKFSPPSFTNFKATPPKPGDLSVAYVVIMSLTFSHVIFRVTFSEEIGESLTGKKIMVTEDSGMVRNLISRTLEQNGFQVEQASDGSRAVELYKTFKPDLCIMDLVMPQMGGFEAMQAIRKLDPKAKFIVLTSSSRRDEVVTAKKIGVLAYIIKPFNPESLMQKVNQAFANR